MMAMFSYEVGVERQAWLSPAAAPKSLRGATLRTGESALWSVVKSGQGAGEVPSILRPWNHIAHLLCQCHGFPPALP